MSLNIEVAELMKQPGRVYEVAEKTQYKLNLTQEDKEIASVMDAKIREIGNTGFDRDHEISQFITRTIQDEVFNAPDYLLDNLFERNSISEFDDFAGVEVAKNTLIAHEAAKGGNVDRSYLNFSMVYPTWKNIQVETDLSYVDMRRNGWKSVANLTVYMTEALQNKMFYTVFNALDAAVTGGDQVISVTGEKPTMETFDELTLYLNEHSDGTVAPFTVSLAKYASWLRRAVGYDVFLSDAMKDEFNRYGFVRMYDGVNITTISSAHKLGDGSLLLPDKRVFGISGRVGILDTKGTPTVYQNSDDNAERIHLLAKNMTFGWAFTKPENFAKITFTA